MNLEQTTTDQGEMVFSVGVEPFAYIAPNINGDEAHKYTVIVCANSIGAEQRKNFISSKGAVYFVYSCFYEMKETLETL